MKESAIVIPVHNRRAITLACLDRLKDDGALAWADVIVVDDGSTDGTGAAVGEKFPQVILLHGNGDLWWTGAIALGMQHARDRGARYILWLNDDCRFRPGSLAQLRRISEERQALVGGTCVIPGSAVVVYGGLMRRGFSFEPRALTPGAIEPCDALSGNLTCFPVGLIDAIGLPDARHLPQAGGDLDYGLRANRAGWPVLAAHDALAEAEPNNWDNHASWLLSNIRPADIWLNAWRKRSYGYFPAQWHLYSRHYGLRGSCHAVGMLLKRICCLVVRLLIPQPWLRRIWGGRSRAWREEQRIRDAIARSGRCSDAPSDSN